MIQLDDPRWEKFEGGYRILYDASIPLRSLEKAKTKEEVENIFKELWNELHHQGDVGIGSYLSVPHIIRIAKEKKLADLNVFGIIGVIEIERHNDNPPLPEEFQEEYIAAIREGIPDLILTVIKEKWDITLSSTILACLAASKGHISMAKAIFFMEDPSIIGGLLDKY